MARKRELDPVVVNEIQKKIGLYFDQQFPERWKEHRKHVPIYKVSEHIGTIFESLYQERCNRSHDPETEVELQKEAAGLAVIYLIEFCIRHGWNFEYILHTTFEELVGKDWVAYPDVGRPPKEETPNEDE